MNTLHKNEKGSKLILILLLSLMLAFCAGLTGCGSDDEMSDDDIDYIMNEGAEEGGAPAPDPEQVEKAKALNQEADNFIGTWAATSGEAENLYGNLQITINEDGTFEGNVTEEEISGTWTKVDNGITYKCDLMKGKIYYGEYGKLVIEDNENGNVKVVLNKVD